MLYIESGSDIERNENLNFLEKKELIELARAQMAMAKSLQHELNVANAALSELRMRFEKIHQHVDKVMNPLKYSNKEE